MALDLCGLLAEHHGMTATPMERARSLTERVAEEVRAMMGRRRISGARLARELGVSDAWVSYRLSGKQPIDLNDLENIARALGVPVISLLPESTKNGESDTACYRGMAERPRDNRPKGHAPRRTAAPGGGNNRRPARIGNPQSIPTTLKAA